MRRLAAVCAVVVVVAPVAVFAAGVRAVRSATQGHDSEAAMRELYPHLVTTEWKKAL